MMPVANPVGWQIDVERVFHARVEVELQLLRTFLNHSELGVALRHVRSTFVPSAQLAWLHIEADGECLA